ncbi:MAG TPA: hypothetical protein VKF63_14575 [Terracidiphilus sp.]|nr:hypothetical protein [Terracidiphilus sp.]
MSKRIFSGAAWILCATAAIILLSQAKPAAAQQIPALATLSDKVVATHPELVKWRAMLVGERAQLRERVQMHNQQCSAVEEGTAQEASCQKALADLRAETGAHIEKSNQFNAAAHQAESAPTPAGQNMQASAATSTEKPLTWENINHPERKAWSDELRKAIEPNLRVLETANDITNFAPNYAILSEKQRIDVWASLFAAIASFEDPHYKTAASYTETKILNKKTGKYYTAFPSIGLFQLSYKEQTAYGWEHVDKNAKSLEDPLVNIRCGVKVLVHLVGRDHVIASGNAQNPRGGARYWSVLQEGKSHHLKEIQEMVRKQAHAE